MGPKDAPCEHPSPAKAFAPAPSAFALPRPRSHFPRPRSHFPRIAFHFPRGAIGLPQQQLSTMGYPRKSYPHCCSPPCAKRSRPRACARVYIIYRSPSRRSPGVFAPLRKRVRAVVPPCPAPPCAGWGGRRQRRTPPRAVPNHAACVPNHCAQRRKCTRQTPPLPVRSPRGSLSTAAPLPADGRSVVRSPRGNLSTAEPLPACVPNHCAQRRKCTRQSPPLPCVLPASARLRPRPRRLRPNHSAQWGRAKAKAEAPSRSNPHFPAYGRAPAA